MLELFTLAMVLEGLGGEISPAGGVRNLTRLQANLRRRFHLHLHLVISLATSTPAIWRMVGNWVCIAGSRTPESGVAEEVASMMYPHRALIEKGIGHVGIKT